MVKRKTIWKWTITTLWICVGAGAITLLAAGVHKEDLQTCKGLSIDIKGAEQNSFVDTIDVQHVIEQIEHARPTGRKIKSFNLEAMEIALERNPWIKDAELFFDNNEILQVKIREREPVARIFTTSGNTFYIDSAITRLPLSDEHAARLPVFTNFPSDMVVLSRADSNLLRDINTISEAISKDSFRMALIDQVDITVQRSFEMIPKVGNNIIVFGDATDVEEKFTRLELFYKNIIAKAGFNYYSSINVQYKGQVVAKRRGAEDIAADSMRTLQLLQLIAENAAKQAEDSLHNFVQEPASDSTDVSMVQQSIQRDDNNEPSNPGELPVIPTQPENINASEKPKPQASIVIAPVKPAVTKPVVSKPITKPSVTKPAAKPNPLKPKPTVQNKPNPVQTKPVKTPKAAMPKRNDY